MPCLPLSLPLTVSTTQVSFTPPPWDELTTNEPSVIATRVNPPGTISTVPSPCDNTKGRKSIWRGAMPLATAVGLVDKLMVGWAINPAGLSIVNPVL